jgi:hypothetical protein
MLLTPSLLRDYIPLLDTVEKFVDLLPSKLFVAASQATENAEGGSDEMHAMPELDCGKEPGGSNEHSLHG